MNHKNDKDAVLEEEANNVEIMDEEALDELEEIEEEIEEEIDGDMLRLGKLLKESDERYLRVIAEYENFRKRTTKEKDAIYPQAVADSVCKFLPMLDSFAKSLEFDPSSEEFAKGIQLIYQGFKDTLASVGVEQFGTVGDCFDPNLHNAVMHKEDPNLGENVVSQVLQQGYRIGDRVIRHAVVETAN